METDRNTLTGTDREAEPTLQFDCLQIKPNSRNGTPPTESHGKSYRVNGARELTGALVRFCREAVLYRENDPAECLYRVVSGTVRTYKMSIDGRRQITAFYMPGDFFGLETGRYEFSAEAVTELQVFATKRSILSALAAWDIDVARLLWAVTSEELKRFQSHLLLLVEGAERRVASFLLEMANRISISNEIRLPMSRQDVADYLGLTVETVSRVLTHLEKLAIIRRPTSRRIVLHSRSALEQLITATGSGRTQRPKGLPATDQLRHLSPEATCV